MTKLKSVLLEKFPASAQLIEEKFPKRNKTLEQQHEIDIFKMQIAWANSVSIIRVHQEEVWNDVINWEKELTDAINEIKNENDVTLKLLGCLKDRVDWWDLK